MKNAWKFLPVVLILTFPSCKKDTCSKENPGTGGKCTVSGTVKHHSEPIPYSRVFIEYGATEFPGTDTTKYDSKVTSDADANYSISDLMPGNYYLYGVGFDNDISLPVTGGIGITICDESTLSSDVPVTE